MVKGIVVEVEIVGNSDTIAGRDWENFMFTIAVECGPLDGARVLAPVVRDFSATVPNDQFTA